jgi:F-type H+-transporting ATPase subunit b
MIIDATFWVAISFFIFIGILVYLKVPQSVNNLLNNKIIEMKKELDEAEKLKFEAKNLLSDYENKIDKSKKEALEIISLAQKKSEENVLSTMKVFHQLMEDRKKQADQKITMMKENALNDIKNISVKISIESVRHLITNSIDKNKLEKIYNQSIEQAKTEIKRAKA